MTFCNTCFLELSYEIYKKLHNFFSIFEDIIGNDIWGWTDPQDDNEYAIIGLSTGTSFVRVTDAVHPEVLGFMPSTGNTISSWRDIKVVNNVAYIVSEAAGHGLQVHKVGAKQHCTLKFCHIKAL